MNPVDVKAVRKQHLSSLEWVGAELGPCDEPETCCCCCCYAHLYACAQVCESIRWPHRSDIWPGLGTDGASASCFAYVRGSACCWWSWNHWNPVCQHPLWSLAVTSGALWPPPPSKLPQSRTQDVSLAPFTTRSDQHFWGLGRSSVVHFNI